MKVGSSSLLDTERVLGFEYWADPDNPEDGFITWQTNGAPSYRLGAKSMGPDMGTNGSMVGQRRIPEEPMVRHPPRHIRT